MRLQREIFQLLRRGGWYPNRQIDLKGIVQFLIARGFLINKNILKFLEEFGSLDLETTNVHQKFSFYLHHINPQKAIGTFKIEHFKIYEEKFGEKLLPIGELFNRYLFLFMSQSGKFYSDLGLLGESFEEALFSVVTMKIKESPSFTSEKNIDFPIVQNICVASDKTMTGVDNQTERDEEYIHQLQLAGSAGVFDHKPFYVPQKNFSNSQSYQDYYKFGLTDAGIDRLRIDHPSLLDSDQLTIIRSEMNKLRQKILFVKKEAQKIDALAFDGSGSFELWPVEYCGEVWAARNAILKGVKFDHIVFRTVRMSDRSLLQPCNNCKKIFSNQLFEKQGGVSYF